MGKMVLDVMNETNFFGVTVSRESVSLIFMTCSSVILCGDMLWRAVAVTAGAQITALYSLFRRKVSLTSSSV